MVLGSKGFSAANMEGGAESLNKVNPRPANIVAAVPAANTAALGALKPSIAPKLVAIV